MRPIHILHVVGAMNQGGVETWLMHVLRHLDTDKFRTDFLVHTDKPAAYDNEIRRLGSRLFPCPHHRNPAMYARHFFELTKRYGPFDVLHSHVHHFSGFTLTLGKIAGTPMRIAHCHNDTSALDAQAGLRRSAYLKISRRLIGTSRTKGLAVSQKAATALFGRGWHADSRIEVLHCGIDPPSPDKALRSTGLRAEFGFSNSHTVYGHVGRFSPQKNHHFLLDCAAQISSIDRHAKFLLIGDGPLRPEIEARARSLGLESHIVFSGLRCDVPSLMAEVIDVLLLPSLNEGLPIVVLEAQAAGTTCLVSEAIPEEACIHPALLRRLALSNGAGNWAHFARQIAKEPRFDRMRASELFRNSTFEISRCIKHLCQVYREHVVDPIRLSDPTNATGRTL